MKPLNIVFTGFFGAGNLGDEAILLSEIRGLSRRRPGSTFTIASFDPAAHHALGLEVFDARDRDALARAVSCADLLIVGGGGLWQDYDGWNPGDLFSPEPYNIAFYARGPLTAAALGTPFVMFANGVGPLSDRAAKRSVASIAALATSVSVRDASSADLLREAGFAGSLTVCADPAFGVVPVTENVVHRQRPIRIGVVPRWWSHGADADSLLHTIGRAVRNVSRKQNAEVVLLRLQRPSSVTTEDDGKAIARIVSQHAFDPDAVHIVDPATPEEAAGWLGSCDAVVTMRLHGAILSAVAGVGSVAILVDPKLAACAMELGLSDLAIPLDSLSSSAVERSLKKAIGRKASLSDAVEAGVHSARILLEAALDRAIDALDRSMASPAAFHRLSAARISGLPCVVLRLPEEVEEARAVCRAASGWNVASIIAVGQAPVCEALGKDPSLHALAFTRAIGGTFGEALQSAVSAIINIAPAAADLIVIDAARFDASAAFQALARANAGDPKAALIAASGPADADASRTGAVQPDIGAAYIKRDIWDEFSAFLSGLETAAGCGADLARRARRRMEHIITIPLETSAAEDTATIEQDLSRADSLTPSHNPYFIPRPATRKIEPILEWIGERDVVVFPPTVGWTVSLVQRTNHMARALAEAGHAVIYSVERAPADQGPPKEVAPGVLTVSEPFSSLAVLKNPIVILYSYNTECASFFESPRVVYEWIDDLSVFVGDPVLLRKAHRIALERSDVVSATAAALWREAAAVRPDALYLPNAVRVADFDPMLAPESELPLEDVEWFEADSRPVAVYWGAIAPWFDDELLAGLATRRPDIRIAVLGPAYERNTEDLKSRAPENLRYFGSRPYGLLASYARRSSAALLPFRPGKISHATSPLKLFEYLAARLPVVSTPLPELTAFENVLMANDAASFSTAIDRAFALKEEPDFRAWSDRTGAQHDWSTRAAAIRAALGIDGVVKPDPIPLPVDFESEPQSQPVSDSGWSDGTQAIVDLLDAELARHERSAHETRAQLIKLKLETRLLTDQLQERTAKLEETEAVIEARDEAISWLRSELSEAQTEVPRLESITESLTAEVKSLTEKMTTQRGAIDAFSVELSRQAIEFASGIAEKELTIERQSQLLEKQAKISSERAEAITWLKDELDQAQARSTRLVGSNSILKTQQDTNKARINRLEQQLSAAEIELEKIKRSIGWRLLSRYGRIKYGYLLPIYRKLHLLPPETKTSTGAAMADRLPTEEMRASVSEPAQSREAEEKIERHSNQLEPEDELKESGHADFYESLTLLPHLQRTEVAAILDQRPPAKTVHRQDVVCFSIIDWDFRYQRPQQIMSQFASHGHRVFYISTTRFLSADARPAVVVTRIKENVYEVHLAAERMPDVYGEVIDGRNQQTLLDALDELRRTYHINDAIGYVMIASWGEVAFEAKRLWGWRTIYDCMDEWENFPGIKRNLLDMELELVQRSDLLVVTGQLLFNKWEKYERPMVLARNAVDWDFYNERCGPNTMLTDVKHPVIGYYGAIADWFDVELLSEAARQRPQYNFVLLGGIFDVDVSVLSALPNVHFLGQQPYETMPQYLYHFDVCMIPFKINPITEATDPVKVYEYLSAGKPVVSVALPELESLSEHVYIARGREDFVVQLDRALSEADHELAGRRRRFAQENTWAKRYQQITEGLTATVPRASVIVVTYNNLALNQLCLESLIRNTEYPNYEVIVVDNNSADGTPAYLRYMAAQHSHISIILNTANNGFARANNQGFVRSSGDYIVLLNNDTIVPPGWLSRLLRHLENDSVGMVGPVTNFVGNEAKIEVGYQTWSEMEDFAARYTFEHDRQSADIHMLAMFCVAFRRSTYEEIGPLDEKFGTGMFEDDDYTQRMKAGGYRVRCAADVFVHHFGQAAFKKLIENGTYDPLFEVNRAYYETKWNVKWTPHKNARLNFELIGDARLDSQAAGKKR